MTAQSIDRKKRIADFIERIGEITHDENMDKKNLYGKRHAAIANECINEQRYLGEGKTEEQAGKKPKLASSTYVSYLTDYRNAIIALNEKGLNTDKDIKRIQKSFKQYDLSLLNAKMPNLRDNLSELKKEYIDKDQSLYLALHKLKIESHAYYRMRPKVDVVRRVKSKNSEQLMTKHTDQKVVSLGRIDQMLSEMDKSEHWADLAIFIALASGRRPIEILKTGGFKKGKKNHVLFDGQAKTKTRDDNPPFIIPTLIDTKRLINAHEKLKTKLDEIYFYEKKFDDLTNEEVNGGTAGRLNRIVKSLLGDSFTFKSLRAIYAKRASTLYHDDKKTSLAVFYSTILGHSEKDIDTQLSYQGIVISDDKTEPAKIEFTTDEPKRDTTGQKTLKEIKAFDKAVEEGRSKAVSRIHEFVKKTLQHDKDAIITQTFLGKSKAMGGAGASRPAIKTYLELIGLK